MVTTIEEIVVVNVDGLGLLKGCPLSQLTSRKSRSSAGTAEELHCVNKVSARVPLNLFTV